MSVDEKKSKDGLSHAGYSVVATILSHPARVWLNLASVHQWPLETIRASYSSLLHGSVLLKGLSFNVLRGSLATGTQSYIKQTIQNDYGILSGVVAAACYSSFVATCIETPLIRQTITHHEPVSSQMTTKLSLWRFSPALSALYFTRELGFSFAVLAKNDFSPVMQYSFLFAGAWVTAVAHKFASLEAVRDRLPVEKTIPNFNQGMGYTLRTMAYGNTYTHPVFQVPFKNPTTLLLMTANLMHVSCGLNMYFFRLLYLVVFREAYDFAVHTAEPLITKSYLGFFNKPKQTALINTELANHRVEKQQNISPP